MSMSMSISILRYHNELKYLDFFKLAAIAEDGHFFVFFSKGTLTLLMLYLKEELPLTGSRTLSLTHPRLLFYPFSYSYQLAKVYIVQLLMLPHN